jgi:hypothetical protein
MIELSAAIAAIRAELLAAMSADSSGVHFPVGQIQMEFQVGVTRTTDGTAGIRLWVLEVGGDHSVTRQETQRVCVNLDPPVDDAGLPIKVSRSSAAKP